MRLLLFCCVVFFAIGCDKSTKTVINGTYIGTFERNGVVAQVELTFSNGQFNGQSDQVLYPAICSGTYTVSGNTISFENGCMWTANFDWTLILSENWTINSSNNSLILTKANGDVYNLIHQ